MCDGWLYQGAWKWDIWLCLGLGQGAKSWCWCGVLTSKLVTVFGGLVVSTVERSTWELLGAGD